MPLTPDEADAAYVARQKPTVDEICAKIDADIKRDYQAGVPLEVYIEPPLEEVLAAAVAALYVGWDVKLSRPRGLQKTRFVFKKPRLKSSEEPVEPPAEGDGTPEPPPPATPSF